MHLLLSLFEHFPLWRETEFCNEQVNTDVQVKGQRSKVKVLRQSARFGRKSRIARSVLLPFTFYLLPLTFDLNVDTLCS